MNDLEMKLTPELEDAIKRRLSDSMPVDRVTLSPGPFAGVAVDVRLLRMEGVPERRINYLWRPDRFFHLHTACDALYLAIKQLYLASS